MHPLHRHLATRAEFSSEEFQVIIKLFDEVEVKKKSLLIQPDQSIKYQYFVIQGCLRTYLIDKEGKEHTIQFAIENWWVSDYLAYYSESPSTLFVECLEDCRLLRVSRNRLEKSFDTFPQLERFFRKQLENAFMAFQRRILSNQQLDSEDRYRDFIRNYPNIEQRVKNYHIASFLGIASESLSRLRRNSK